MWHDPSASGRQAFDRAGIRALTIYTVFGFTLFGLPLIGHFHDSFLSQGSDPSLFSWFLTWWPRALAHRTDPFFTEALWSPKGVNVAWTTSIPLPAILASPITLSAGPIAAFNVLLLIGAPLSAWTTFLLCRELSKSWWPSLVGGYIFGFSAYMAGQQACGHIHLTLVMLVPLAAFVIARAISTELSPRIFIPILASILVAEFLISMEVFATMTVAGGCVLLLGRSFASTETRGHLRQFLWQIVAAYGVAAAILGPFLYGLFAWGAPVGGVWSADAYSNDVLNFVLAVPSTALGTIKLVERWTMPFRLGGSIAEMDGYVGLPLAVVFLMYVRKRFREPLGRTLIEFFIIFMILSLGPRLRFDGVPTIGLPFKLFLNIPMLNKALPGRLMMYGFLALGVITALWLKSAEIDKRAKIAIAAAIVITTLPTPSGRWITPADLPAFFGSDSYRHFLTPADSVLALPFGIRGSSMLWQAEAKMSFKLVGGYGPSPEDFDGWPIAAALTNSTFLPDGREQMAACLAHYGATVVVVSQTDPDAISWDKILVPISSERHRVGGINFYRLASSLLAPYSDLDSSEMTHRATAAAIDSLIMAANQWRLRGNDPVALTPAIAVQNGWLEASWFLGPNTIPGWSTGGPDQTVPTTLHLRAGAWLGGTPSGDYGVGLEATYAALEPVIAKYRAFASNIYFPFPNDLLAPSAAMPAPTTEALLTLVFDKQQLARAASALPRLPEGPMLTAR